MAELWIAVWSISLSSPSDEKSESGPELSILSANIVSLATSEWHFIYFSNLFFHWKKYIILEKKFEFLLQYQYLYKSQQWNKNFGNKNVNILQWH